MHDTIRNLINDSEEVINFAVQAESVVTLDSVEFLKVEGDVSKTYKGTLSPRDAISVFVPTAGKETPHLDVGQTYLLFMQRAKAPATGEGIRVLVDLSAPIHVPNEKSILYDKCMTAYKDVAVEPIESERLKSHILDMLDCGANFFQEDASSEALSVEKWNQTEIDRLIECLYGEGANPPLNGATRENVTSVVITHGGFERALRVARAELKAGNSDAVYFGLDERPDQDLERILQELVKSEDKRILLKTIRIIGLLRQGDMLNSIELQISLMPLIDKETRSTIDSALVEARSLLDRDI